LESRIEISHRELLCFLAVGTTSAAPSEGVRRGSTWSVRKMTRRCL